MYKSSISLVCLSITCLAFDFEEKQNYNFYNDPIDVIIPCHQKDGPQLDLVISLIRNNVLNLNRVIVISTHKFTDKAEWFPEENFPFSKWDIALEIYKGDSQQAKLLMENPKSRLGWIFQQLLKLYSPLVIPNISSNVLVVDSDVHIFKPITFTDQTTYGALLTPAYEYHQPYFNHAERLIPGFKRITQYSGIAHHMLFQKSIITDLFNVIETEHKTVAWKAICRCIDLNVINFSSLSEYEIYFNFALARSDKIKIRHLNWKNIYSWENTYAQLINDQHKRRRNEFDFIAYHIF